MRTYITLAILLAISLGANAQEILGLVTDKLSKEPIVNVSVSVKQGGIVKGSTITDFDGKYSIKPLDPGYYDVTVSYLGYKTTTIKQVIVSPGQKTGLNIAMERATDGILKEVQVKTYRRPLVDKYKTTTVMTDKEIKNTGRTTTADLVEFTPSIYQSQRGAPVNAASPVYLNTSTESYKKVEQNDYKNVKISPVSTMSVDVDRASYTNIRRFIANGQKPPVDAVRLEEMVNYFQYDYPQPKGNDPVAFNTQLTTCPWNKDHLLLHIGLQAKTVNTDKLPASNLVFLIDVSGSMYSDDKLPLLQKGLNMLVDS